MSNATSAPSLDRHADHEADPHTTWVIAGPGPTTTRPATLSTPRPAQVDPLVRQGNAVYVGLHGLLHLFSAAALWTATEPAVPILRIAGLSPSLAAVAVGLLGIAFLASAVLLSLGRGWRAPLTVAAVLSTVAALTSLPVSALCLGVNACIGVGLLASRPRR